MLYLFIGKNLEKISFVGVHNASHNHRLSRWLGQPYKGMLLAGLKAH